MFCNKCGTQNPDQAVNCQKCGLRRSTILTRHPVTRQLGSGRAHSELPGAVDPGDDLLLLALWHPGHRVRLAGQFQSSGW